MVVWRDKSKNDALSRSLNGKGPSDIIDTGNSTETEIAEMYAYHDIDEGMELRYMLTTLSAMILIHDLWEYLSFRRRFFSGRVCKNAWT